MNPIRTVLAATTLATATALVGAAAANDRLFWEGLPQIAYEEVYSYYCAPAKVSFASSSEPAPLGEAAVDVRKSVPRGVRRELPHLLFPGGREPVRRSERAGLRRRQSLSVDAEFRRACGWAPASHASDAEGWSLLDARRAPDPARPGAWGSYEGRRIGVDCATCRASPLVRSASIASRCPFSARGSLSVSAGQVRRCSPPCSTPTGRSWGRTH